MNRWSIFVLGREEITIGTIIVDNGKMGMIISIMQNGSWNQSEPLELLKIYQVRYKDGLVSIIKEKDLIRLIESGKIKIIAY